jgi:iron complex outermembrane receptor protein
MKISLVIFVLVSTINWGQNCIYTLTGRVVDIHSGEPISNAKIDLNKSNKFVLSDSLGIFILSDVCIGTVELRCIPHFGCEPFTDIYTISGDTNVTLRVETHKDELDEILVLAYRFPREAQTSYVLKREDAFAVKGSTLGDQLKSLPGVSSLNTGASIVKPVINGMHSNRLVTVNNDIRQEGQQWGSEHAPEIDPNLADEIEVIHGASGLEYGPDAIGGVIIVRPEKLAYGREVSGWFKFGGNSNGRGANTAALISGALLKKKNLAYRIHGSGRVNGTISTPTYFMKNTALNEYAFSGALGYRMKRLEMDFFYSQFTTNLGIFSGSHIGNLTDLNAAFNAEQPKDSGYFTYKMINPRQFIRHQLSKLHFQYTWKNSNVFELIYGYQYNLRQEYDMHKAYGNNALNTPDFELNLWTNTLDVKQTWNISNKLSQKFGLSGLEQSNAYSGRFFIPNFKKWQIGGYYIGEYTNKSWLVSWGARYDISSLNVYVYEQNILINPQYTFQGISYSAGVSKLFGHHWIAKINAGSSWRPPSINEMYADGLHHGAASIEVGDQALHEEIVYNIQAGVQYKSRLATLDVSGYYNYFNGFVYLNPVLPPQLTIVGAFPVFQYKQTNATFFGTNVKMNVPIRYGISLNLQTALLKVTDVKTREGMFGIPANRWSASLNGKWKLGKTNWKCLAEFEFQQVAKQTHVPDNSDFVDPPAVYSLMHAQLGFTYPMMQSELQLILGVTNLTNVAYRDYLNRFRYFTNEMGRNWSLKVSIPINSKK